MRHFLELSIIVLLVLPFSVATSPVPAPYHQYVVGGILERPSGGSRANFAVTLLGWYHNQSETGYQTLPRAGNPQTGEIPVALTDSTGAFFLVVNSSVEADSLKLSVVVPDRQTIFGTPVGKDSLQTGTNTETIHTDSKSGCSGCGTNPETEERVVYYSHYISRRSVTVPF